MKVRGGEPEGVIAPVEYERERAALAERLSAMPGPAGQTMGNRGFTPQQLYRSVRGVAPDLIVYLGDLAWRAVGTVGGGAPSTVWKYTRPDGANRDQVWLFI